MMRAFISNLAGLTLLVALFFWALFHTVPAGAAECRGQIVKASWFGAETCRGKPPGRGKGFCQTAAGIPFDGSQWLVAHRTLGMGTVLRLTHAGRSVTVPVGDRGPYIRGREIDLSHAVAVALGTIGTGVAEVCMERVHADT